MADQERKRLIFLGVVLAVLAIVALVQMWGRDGLVGGGVSAEELTYEPRQFPQLVAIDIDRDVENGETVEHRNPFTYGKPPTPTPNLTPPPTKTPRPTRPPVTPGPKRTPKPRGTPKPIPPDFDREFIGHLGPERLKVAAFRMHDKETEITTIDVAVVGQVLDEKFIVREIGLESVVIGFVGFDASEDTRVPLAEK